MTVTVPTSKADVHSYQKLQALAETGNLSALEAELDRTCSSAKDSLAFNEEWLVDDSCQCECGKSCPISKYRCIPCTVLSRGGNLKQLGPLREGERPYRIVRSPMGHPKLTDTFAQEIRARYLLKKLPEVPEYYGSYYCSGSAIHLLKTIPCAGPATEVEASHLLAQLTVLLKKLYKLGFELATVSADQLDLIKVKRRINISGNQCTFKFSVLMPRVHGLALAGEGITHWMDHDYLKTLSPEEKIQYHGKRLLLELAQQSGLIAPGDDWCRVWGPHLATANACLEHKLRLPVQVMAARADQK